MHRHDKTIRDYDAVLDAKYGKLGTADRAKAEAEARAFYASQVLRQARRELGITQAELAKRVGITTPYISKIENGVIEPGVGLFYRLIGAMGLDIEIVKPLGL